MDKGGRLPQGERVNELQCGQCEVTMAWTFSGALDGMLRFFASRLGAVTRMRATQKARVGSRGMNWLLSVSTKGLDAAQLKSLGVFKVIVRGTDRRQDLCKMHET